MKKLLYRFILCIGVMLVFAGCVDAHITADVSSGGEITGSMRMLAPPSVLKMTGMTVDEAIQQLEEQYASEFPEATVRRISGKVRNTSMEGIEIEGVTHKDFTASKEGQVLTVTIPLRELIDSAAEAAQVEVSTLKRYGSVVDLTVNMPSEASANVGTAEGNTVIIDLLNIPDGTDTAEITCIVEEDAQPDVPKPKPAPEPAEEPEVIDTSMIWYEIGIVVLLGAGVALVLFSKNE